MKLIDFVSHPEEILPTLQMMYADYRLKNMEIKDPAVRFCYNMLNRVSRRSVPQFLHLALLNCY